MLPSSQSPSVMQQPGIGAFTHPCPESQKSLVQIAGSLQSGGVAGWQPGEGLHVWTPSDGLAVSQGSGVPVGTEHVQT